jgi:hypothetical protein
VAIEDKILLVVAIIFLWLGLLGLHPSEKVRRVLGNLALILWGVLVLYFIAVLRLGYF